MTEQNQTENSSSSPVRSGSSTVLPSSHSSKTGRMDGGCVASPPSAPSQSDTASLYLGPPTNSTPFLFAEPPHMVECSASGSNDAPLGPKEPPQGFMPCCLSYTLFPSTCGQESEDVYGRSMPSACTTGTTTISLGCAAAHTLPASFTPGASTSMTPALTEAHSVSGVRSVPQLRWGGNYDSGSQCMSFRGVDRSSNLSGFGLRLVGDEAEWMQDSFEDSAPSPREEVQLSWRHLQQPHPTRKNSVPQAMPPALNGPTAVATLEKAHAGQYRFERAVQPPTQRQASCVSAEEEDRQAAAMLWAAQQMAASE
ncbi:hypothetical protein JKF63_07492 [Porcisia hertigi]|uniref:Uncharacterized protein n=1 Tax=Porcisia hertigi TaxID=2761500 RepID=A0A836I1V8_9TRYP|nr:hypothetical protein JKF63_07492 [Porcisia hertigi]